MSVCPHVHTSVRPQKLLRFQWNLIYRSTSDAWRYAVWLDPRSRSRSWALESRKFDHFQTLSSPPFIRGASWQMTTHSYIMAQYLKLIGPGFLIFVLFLCHVTSKLAVSRSRPSVPYGANFKIILSVFLLFLLLSSLSLSLSSLLSSPFYFLSLHVL